MRKLAQDALHFLLFLGHIAFNIVIEINYSQGLDEKGGTRATLVVDDAREIHFIFLFNRYNIAVTTHGNNIIHKILLIIGIVEDAVQLILHAIFGNLNGRAQAVQLGRSIILNLGVLIDSTRDLLFQARKLLHATGIFGQGRSHFRIGSQELLHGAQGLRRGLDVQQLLRQQRAAQLRPLHIAGDIKGATKGKALALVHNAQGLRSFLLQCLNLAKIAFDLQCSHSLLTQKSARFGCQQAFDLIKFQCFDCKACHLHHTSKIMSASSSR